MQDSITPTLSLKLQGNVLDVHIENSLSHASVADKTVPCLISEKLLDRQVLGEVVLVGSLKQKLLDLDAMVHGNQVCLLLEGCSGCGKTALLKALSELHGRREGSGLVTIHLGEQVDGKMLLGAFTCSNVPGEFVWVPGILTKAVLSVQWVVLEDIDCAPSDVLSLLLSVVKSRSLMLPGYSEAIRIPHNFKMFATKRLSESWMNQSVSQSKLLSILENHCGLLSLSPYTHAEKEKIISTLHPNLVCLSDQLTSACDSLHSHLRQVLKFCNRMADHIHDGCISSVDDMMLELIDCFVDCKDKFNNALKLRSVCGGMSLEKVEQLCFKHKPSLQLNSFTINVGRGYLTCSSEFHSSMCFAYTQQSLCLLEKVCRCVQMKEPVLLVGETGVGKTTTVHYLASVSGNKLVVVNMNQQSDSTDLLGGFKPVPVAQIVLPVREQFEKLFHATFSVKQNVKFLANMQKCFAHQQWQSLFKMMQHSLQAALKRLEGERDNSKGNVYLEWQALSKKLHTLREQLNKPHGSFLFNFVEGVLVSAVRNGWWILLDEINLATAETLQCLSSLLEGPQGSFLITEQCDLKPVERHQNFRLFCCMNPATDVGKKSLPYNIRNRFTEFFVEEVENDADLRVIISGYLADLTESPQIINGIIQYYRSVRELAETRLLDGTGRKPHYSLRNLCRGLNYAANNPFGSPLRSLFEGLCMSFLTQLRQDHHQFVIALVKQCLGITEHALKIAVPQPKGYSATQIEGFWLAVGSETPVIPDNFVLTKSVKMNLKNLARVVSARRYPVLLQGPTSAGKTSLVQYLAKATGHRCLRVNNHEHTDLQEYIGMYTAGSDGQLVFQEGVLVEAMRKGYWIILDELNLAPTDVLEALNRVLDDNRELFIPETQQVVKAHPHFLLFGTQNPPGQYGGRKVLSQAFRNRFIELHYEDIPCEELVIVLQERCKIPQSYAKRMVAVMKDLQQQRSMSGIFAGKYGLITLRDLFRWAERYRRSSNKEQFQDWEQQLAEDGFMLLAGRVRNVSEENLILEVIEKHFKREVKPSILFGINGSPGGLASEQTLKLLRSSHPPDFSHIVWTPELLRMAVLVHRAIMFDEPVLLVGNTGCGKTSVCQLLSQLLGKELLTINCHMHTEASDFLGGLRPVRHTSEEARSLAESEKLFEWCDGVLVQAMHNGSCLLIDEISLAEDAVLERLNSVLEPERKLLISERGNDEDASAYEIVAHKDFVLFATMNPGGDYGKKELSLALRNRFVEIWAPAFTGRESCEAIINHNLRAEFKHCDVKWSSMMLDITDWMQANVFSNSRALSTRDLLTWVSFMNTTFPTLSLSQAFYHGAHLTFLDGLGCNGCTPSDSPNIKEEAIKYVEQFLVQSKLLITEEVSSKKDVCSDTLFGIAPFYISKGPRESTALHSYSLEAKGPCENGYRLLRALQLRKPILLEGGPGVGKTTLVTALAKASGHGVVRINLSEHTDTSDLFGSDLPVEGAKGLKFAWKDGPFLKALKNGDWILLDEMNLASQSVLESLNACLDHRGEIFIPELDMTFKVQTQSRLFACQNPLQQGGGRKGLPKSFLNRFTQVFISPLTSEDLLFITTSLYRSFPSDLLQRMVTFNQKVETLTRQAGNTLWEFNLRDILRWCELLQKYQTPDFKDPGMFVELIYVCRLRNLSLRSKVRQLFEDVFDSSSGNSLYPPPSPLGSHFYINRKMLQVGYSTFSRGNFHSPLTETQVLDVQHDQIPFLDAVLTCVNMGWMSILVGSSCSGKSSVVKVLAELSGNKLVEFPMNSDADTTELLGGFEQLNCWRHCSNFASLISDVLKDFRGFLVKELSYSTNNKRVTILRSLDMIHSLLSKITAYLPEVSMKEDIDSKDMKVKLMELEQMLQNISEFSNEFCIKPLYDIQYLKKELQQLNDLFLQERAPGQFEWVDSSLVKALKLGHWLYISNANFCSPSVLDRLNALLEPGGVLTVDERGIVGNDIPTIKPHPNFRLFLGLDPVYGELSRAMRNRGIEIFMSQKEMDTAGQCVDLLSNKVMTTPESVVCPEVSIIRDHCLSFLTTLQGSNNMPKQAVVLSDVSSKLAVFTSMTSGSDYQIRLGVLQQMTTFLKHAPELRFEVQSVLTGLKEMMKDVIAMELMNYWTAQTGLCPGSLWINPLVVLKSSNNSPLTTAAEMWLCKLSLRIMQAMINEHCGLGVVQSPLQISYAAHNGTLPLSFLEDTSLLALYPFFRIFVKTLVETTTPLEQAEAVKLHCALDWFIALLRVAMIPGTTLSDIAVAVNFCSEENFQYLVSVLSASDCTAVTEEMEKLKRLKVLLFQGQLLASWKSLMGHQMPQCSEAAALALKELYLKDKILCMKIGERGHDDDLVQSRRELGNLLAQLYRKCTFAADTDMLTEPIAEMNSNLPNYMVVTAALKPVTCIFTQIVIAILQNGAYPDVNLINSLLAYCLKLSFVGINHLEPFFVLQTAPEANIKEFIPQLLISSALSGYSIRPFSQFVDGDCSIEPLIYQNNFSDSCFKLLSPEKPVPAVSVGNFREKMKEISAVLHQLWIISSADVCSFACCSQSELKLLQSMIQAIVSSLAQCVASHSTYPEPDCNNLSPDIIKHIFEKAAEMLPGSPVAGMLDVAGNHLVAAHTIGCTIQTDTNTPDLGRLLSQKIANVHLGITLSVLAFPCSPIDPVGVENSKWKYLNVMLGRLSNHAAALNNYLIVTTGKQLKDLYTKCGIATPAVTPFLQSLNGRIDEISSQLQTVDKKQRPDPSKYPQLLKACTDLMTHTCSPHKIGKLLETVESSEASSKDKIRSWSVATMTALNRLVSDYSDYPDIVKPVVMAVLQILDGLNMAADIINWKSHEKNKYVTIAADLLDLKTKCHLKWVESAITVLTSIWKQGTPTDEWGIAAKQVMIVAVEVSWHHLSSYREIPSSWKTAVISLLEAAWAYWQCIDEQDRAHEKEKEELYVYKTQYTSVNKDEEDSLEQLFPNYSNVIDTCKENAQLEYEETSVPKSRDDLEKQKEKQLLLLHFTPSEMMKICGLYMSLYSCDCPKTLSPFIQATGLPFSSIYELAANLMRKGSSVPGSLLDDKFAAGHIQMCVYILKSLQGSSDSKSVFNIYKESSPDESQKALLIVERMKSQVEELLSQWPEHPVLMQILHGCAKVLQFDILDPLMKILAGLEYILLKAQEWETNASIAVSLKDSIEGLTSLILEWRKMELSSWKKLFVICKSEARDNGAKWWFHLLFLCNNQANKGTSEVADFTTAVHMLMETSPVGEFLLRLQLLHSCSKDLFRRGQYVIANILGNTCTYYEQFLPDITCFIQKHVEPLEKELQDFVTIQRWSDGNYWALKTSTEKSRKTLKKLMDKYKAILQETVQVIIPQAMLTFCSRVGPIEQHSRNAMSLVTDCEELKQTSVIVQFPNGVELSTHEIFSKLTNMLQSYAAEEFHLDLCFAVADLSDQATKMHQSLEEFQMSVTEAKAVKMQTEQHKKALNDLFKTLHKEGLSYRKGQVSKDVYNCESVFNLPVGHFLSHVMDSNCWDEAHKLFFENITGAKCLESFLRKPSKQLNSSQLSRIQGFSAHLLRFLCEEKEILASFPEHLLELNHIVTKFRLAIESEGMVLSTAAFNMHKCTLHMCFEECIDAVTELQVLLESKPANVDFSLTPLNPTQTRISLFSEKDSLQALAQLQECGQHMKALYNDSLTKQWKCRTLEEPFATRKEVHELEEGFKFVDDFANILSGLEILESNPLYGYLTTLSVNLHQKAEIASIWIDKIKKSATPPTDCVHQLFKDRLAQILQPLMIGVQKAMQFVKQTKTEEGDFFSLLITHEAITKNLQNIGLMEVAEQSNALLGTFLEHSCSCCLRAVSSVCYILQQYCVFVTKMLSDGLIFHSHMCKLFSVILKLFCTVTNKGFHSDVSNETDKETTESAVASETEAGGFDDGATAEDSKNVDPTDVDTESNNLAEGQKTSQDGKDDENVLENCDNFEGALETVEDGDDSKSDEGSESDYSEEMGSVEENQEDHLDEHLWAPDEDEKANMDKKPDDSDIEQGQGTAMDDEQKIVAKDEDNTTKAKEEVDFNENCQLEDEPLHSDNENGSDLMGEPLDDCLVASDVDDANIDSDDDIGDGGESEHKENNDDQGNEKGVLESDIEGNDDEYDNNEEDTDDVPVTREGESKTNMPESINSICGLKDTNENNKDSSNTIGVGACERQIDNETEDAEDVDSRVNEVGSENSQKPRSDKGQPSGRPGAADKRPRENPVPELAHRPAIEPHTTADNEEKETPVKRLKLGTDTVDPIAEDTSDPLEYLHKPDGSACTWDIADKDQDLQKNLNGDDDDDEICIETKNTSDADNTKRHNLSLEENVSYFSNHTAFLADVSQDIEALKQMRQQILAGTEPFQTQDQQQLAVDLWVKYETLVSSLSHSLYEELRIILQPTLAAHLRGDFRSGKKLNMRRIVPYIASGFRNDKIWLRRVKPSRRDYEILISVDDSSSMAENNCVEMAYKSIAMISGALQRLDCGQLGVFKFGENTDILHPFDQAFTSTSGAVVLQRMTFTQTRTNFVKMMHTAASMFSQNEPKHHVDIKQLLIILSDGRGVFSEGETAMELTVRYMNQMGVLTVFIIMDCSAQDSIVNIQVPIFRPGQAPQIKKYLETFPFQFYVVLKDVASLPTVLGQALHQWFEYINKS